MGLICFEYFLGLTYARYYNLKVPRGMQRGEGKGKIMIGVLGKQSCFRSMSNKRLKNQDSGGFSEVMGEELQRNRSLKQLFGELPTILKNTSQFTSRNRGGSSELKRNAQLGKEQKKEDEGEKKRNSKIQDEYLLKKPKRKEKEGGQREFEYMEGKEELGHKRRDNKVLQQPKVKKDDNKLKMQVYNPAAYNWRNTLSREKGDKLAKHPFSPRMPALIQSEYFPSLNNSQKNQVKETKKKKNQQKPRPMSRSNSTDSVRKLGLRPRVVKLVFQPRSPNQRQDNHSKRKSNLLFTFGL